MDFIEKFQYKYKQGNLAYRIIVWHLVAGFALWILDKFYDLKSLLLLSPHFEVVLNKPWQLFTHFLYPTGLFSFLVCLALIYIVQPIFYQYFRNPGFAKFYFYGLLAGGLSFLAVSPLLKDFSPLGLTTAGIMSIIFALASYMPKMPLQLAFFQTTIRLDYIMYFLLGWDVLMIISGNNPGEHAAQIGGGLFGWLYMKAFEKGNDFLGAPIDYLLGKRAPSIKPKFEKPSYNYEKPKPPRDDYDYNAQKKATQNKVDALLDKISKSGYDSLTKSEKDFLFKHSRK